MALLRARLYRRWIRWPWRDKALPINTVHDSVVFDCASEDIAERVAIEVHEVIDELAGEMKKLWDIDVPVPIKAETEWGPTWSSMEKQDVDAIKAKHRS